MANSWNNDFLWWISRTGAWNRNAKCDQRNEVRIWTAGSHSIDSNPQAAWPRKNEKTVQKFEESRLVEYLWVNGTWGMFVFLVRLPLWFMTGYLRRLNRIRNTRLIKWFARGLIIESEQEEVRINRLNVTTDLCPEQICSIYTRYLPQTTGNDTAYTRSKT